MFQTKLPMNKKTKRITHTKTTILSIHSSIFFAIQNTNAKFITQNFQPVQIDTNEKQHPEKSKLKSSHPFCSLHFFSSKKSKKIFITTKNLDEKIWTKKFRPQNNHQKFFRHFFQAIKKSSKKIPKKIIRQKKLNQIFRSKKMTAPKIFPKNPKPNFP